MHACKHVQAHRLYEFNMFRTFLPGSEVPRWFNNKSTGFSICFNVPLLPNLKIQGLNVCVVYARTERKHNVPRNNHWNMRNQLECGDEVDVSVFLWSTFYLKEFGVHVVYEQEKKGT
ncbi:hypothetical protein ACSBR2_018463 [Camellia fascicularis]